MYNSTCIEAIKSTIGKIGADLKVPLLLCSGRKVTAQQEIRYDFAASRLVLS